MPSGAAAELADYLVRIVQTIQALLISAQDSHELVASHLTQEASLVRTSFQSALDLVPSAADIVGQIKRFVTYGLIATTTGMIEAVNLLEVMLKNVPGYAGDLALRLVRAISESVHAQLQSLVASDDEARRVWQLVDLALAVVFGIFRYGLLSNPRGLDELNDFDLVQWLRLNGASDDSLNSAIIHALYDLPFAYEQGDRRMPRLAAGAGLRGALRLLFTYRGSMVWKLNAGMGDVVFAPFYQLLKRRGVTFKFFHRLRNMKLHIDTGGRERPYIAALEFDEQAQVKSGSDYQPLINVHGVPSWPARPDYAQLLAGEQLKNEGWEFESHWEPRRVAAKTLRVTDDFDCVVLAVGLGAIPYVGSELVEHDPRWHAMITHCRTTATQAFQIWMNQEIEDLAAVGIQTTLTGFVQPFETCADMRQMIGQENWTITPRSAAYFCGVLPDEQLPADPDDIEFLQKARQQVRRNAVRFLSSELAHLWPGVLGENGFRWNMLVDPSAGSDNGDEADQSRFDSQFWTANVNPSDRYCLSLPGTLQYRISPLDNSYDNLTIAGDWTECGLNTGCVEAAVISGRLAAHAICGCPRLHTTSSRRPLRG
jgi:uncharacterized protein with NAD-binding domain and iron-sulfur cluster